MTIIRPINSSNEETLSMPTAKSAPDTSPPFLAAFFNRIFNAIAHWHNDGTKVRPKYLKDGGLWGYTDAQNLLSTFLFRDVAGVKKDLPLLKALPGPLNAVAFATGHAEPLPEGITDIDDLMEPGEYSFGSVSNAPFDISVGLVAVKKFSVDSQVLHSQIVYGIFGQMAIRSGVYDEEQSEMTWEEWTNAGIKVEALTLEEYDDLPDSKLTDGVLRLIFREAGGGG